MARTVIEGGIDVDLPGLIDAAVSGLPEADAAVAAFRRKQALLSGLGVVHGQQGAEPARVMGRLDAAREPDTETPAGEIYDFILERLRGYYADRGVPATHFNAVAELRPASLYDFDRRIDAIDIFAALPEAEALAAANKRIGNILKKADTTIPAMEDPSLFAEPAERALGEAVEAALGDTGDALHQHDYVRVLERLARVRPQVDAFFDQVMVTADDPAIRANRRALLKRLADRFGAVAAIGQLSS